MLTERGWALSSVAATTSLEPEAQVQAPGRGQAGVASPQPLPRKGQGWEDAGRGPGWEKLYVDWGHTWIGKQALPLSCQGKGISLSLSLLSCKVGTRAMPTS